MPVAQGLSIYGHGVDLARFFKEYNPTSDVETHDATTLFHTSKVFERGFKNGTISVSAVWKYNEVDFNEVDNVIGEAYENDTNIVLTASKLPVAIGGHAELSDVFVTKYSKPAQNGQLMMLSADFQATQGISFGKWLFNATVNNTSVNGTAIDNGDATTNGGLFHAHIQNIDLVDLANDSDVVLQHSTDNSTWVNLISGVSFTLINNNSNGYITAEVAVGTTIRQYIRVVATTAGGSAVIQAAFARR